MSSRLKLSARYGINTAILVALAVGIIVMIEALSYRHNWRKDFTANKRHSLSEQTLNLLHDLNEKIRILVFTWKASPAYEEAKALFDLYEYESEMVDVEMVDPDLNPRLANEYEIRRYGVPVAFFEGERGRETITRLDEEQATNALIKITRAEKKVVYFLAGHGERPLDKTDDGGLSIVKKLLEDKNYRAETLLLMRADKVPDDCAVLAVCGPEKDLAEPELETIERYIKAGGRVLFLVDPEAAPSLKPFLERYGIVLGSDIMVDRMSRLFGGDYLAPILTTYSNHPITENFSVASFFSLARSVTTTEADGVRASWLARTGEGSWAESDMSELAGGSASFDPEKDMPGPVSLAAVSEIEMFDADTEDSPESKQQAAIVVFGDSDFATNARINLSGNSDMLMNTINWLGREETLIAIRPKESKFSPVILTAADARMLFVLPVIVLPGIVLIGGVYVFARRSRHP